ncbi:MAG: hypothetical protein VW362_06910, partial [Candidatus Nanopelagicales bacterium]
EALWRRNQSGLANALEAKLPGITEKLDVATATGGDVEIPTSALAKMPVLFDALRDHVRFSPEEPSIAEKREADKDAPETVKKLQQDIDEITKQQEQTEKELDAIEEKLKTELVTAGRAGPQATADAAVWRQVASVIAPKLRMTPERFAKAFPAHVVVGAAQRGLSQPAHFDTPEFKAWFGDSKVVDSAGRPRVVYHGTQEVVRDPGTTTRDERFTQASRDAIAELTAQFGLENNSDAISILENWERAGIANEMGLTGKWLTKLATARHLLDRAKPRYRSGGVRLGFDAFRMPADGYELGAHFGTKQQAETFGDAFGFYLSLKNPLRLPDLGVWGVDSVIREARSVGVSISEQEVESVHSSEDRNDALRRLLTQKGYDGVVYANKAEGKGQSFIAFRPEQIKSVNNRGAYDPADPHILRQGNRGSFDPVTWAISLTKNAHDPSTVLHEFLHGIVEIYASAVNVEGADPQLLKDLDDMVSWAGFKGTGAEFAALAGEVRTAMAAGQQHPRFTEYEAVHEKLADEWERWWATGRAPTEELRPLFAKFMSWLKALFQRVFTPETTPDVLKPIFARMVASEEAIAKTQAIRGIADTFTKREDFAGTDAEWAEIKELEAITIASAESKLTLDSIRQTEFVKNLRARVDKSFNEERAAERAAREKAGATAAQEIHA